MSPLTESLKPHLPTEEEIELSERSSHTLATHLPKDRFGSRTLKIVEEDGTEEQIELPASALHLLIELLSQMAQGNAVTLIPIHAELTTQEAADLLNVSRPYLVKLLETNEIPFWKVGRHRRVRFEDLMKYKERVDRDRRATLDELAAQAQELNLYD